MEWDLMMMSAGKGSGVTGPVERASVPKECGAHIVDTDGFRAAIDAAAQGLTGEAVELRNHFAGHPRLIACVGRYLADLADLDHLRTDDLGHLIEIDVGLIVAPRGIEDVPDLETVGLLALGAAFALPFGPAPPPLEMLPNFGGRTRGVKNPALSSNGA